MLPFPVPRSRKEVVSRGRERASEVRYSRVFSSTSESENQTVPMSVGSWEKLESSVV